MGDAFGPSKDDIMREVNASIRKADGRRLAAAPSVSADIIRQVQAAERARQARGRTLKSTFNNPGISSMESLLREF